MTLIELMITMSIIAIMSSMVLYTVYNAQETAKADKTKALIAKLDSIIKAKWDSYKTRRVPLVNYPPPPLATDPMFLTKNPVYLRELAQARLDGLRDLMRMEMPERWTDITSPPVAPFASTNNPMPTAIQRPSVSQGYLRKYNALPKPPTPENQYAECLYLIVMNAIAEEGDAREVFKPDDVKDTDGDGMPEFVDAWGRPIRYLRWAPGLQDSELQIVGRFQATPAMGNQVALVGAGLSSDPGAYIGGAIIGKTGPNGAMNVTSIGHITRHDPAAATVDYDLAPSATPPIGPVLITAPDPFDPQGVYATPPPAATFLPSFATYPLIFSAGPDGYYAMVCDGSPMAVNYSTSGLNPFRAVGGNFIGTQMDLPGEPGSYNGWLDNIHNHMITAK